jgi:hypothetical protein
MSNVSNLYFYHWEFHWKLVIEINKVKTIKMELKEALLY